MLAPMPRTRAIARRAARRAMAIDLARWSAWTLLAAGAALAVLAAGDRASVLELSRFGAWVGGAIGGAGVVGALLAWRGRWSTLRAASEVDRAGRLRDRLSTGLALADASARDGFTAWAVDDAETAAAGCDPSRVSRLEPRAWWLAGPALIASACALMAFAPRWAPAPSTGHEADAHAAATLEEIGRIADELRAVQDEPALDSVATPEDLAALEDLEREVREGALDPDDARAEASRELARMAAQAHREAALEEQATDAVREAIPEAFEGERARQLADALRAEDLAEAQRSLDAFADELERLPPGERERALDELRRLAEAMDASAKTTDATPPAPNDGAPTERPTDASPPQGAVPPERTSDTPERADPAPSDPGEPPPTDDAAPSTDAHEEPAPPASPSAPDTSAPPKQPPGAPKRDRTQEPEPRVDEQGKPREPARPSEAQSDQKPGAEPPRTDPAHPDSQGDDQPGDPSPDPQPGQRDQPRTGQPSKEPGAGKQPASQRDGARSEAGEPDSPDAPTDPAQSHAEGPPQRDGAEPNATTTQSPEDPRPGATDPEQPGAPPPSAQDPPTPRSGEEREPGAQQGEGREPGSGDAPPPADHTQGETTPKEPAGEQPGDRPATEPGAEGNKPAGARDTRPDETSPQGERAPDGTMPTDPQPTGEQPGDGDEPLERVRRRIEELRDGQRRAEELREHARRWGNRADELLRDPGPRDPGPRDPEGERPDGARSEGNPETPARGAGDEPAPQDAPARISAPEGDVVAPRPDRWDGEGRTVGEWYAPDAEPGEGRAETSPASELGRAQRAAEQAIDEQLVPLSRRDYVRRVFERLREAASEPDGR